MAGFIYHAFDTSNGKAYVGQVGAFGKILEDRKDEHLRSKANRPFSNALRARPEAFVWTVLTSELMSQQELDEAEVYWGMFFNTLVSGGYNLKLGQGHTVWSEEERENNRIIQKKVWKRPGYREMMSAKHEGKKQSLEQVAKRVRTFRELGRRKGVKHSEKTKTLIRMARAEQVFSDETRKRLSEKAKKQWDEGRFDRKRRVAS